MAAAMIAYNIGGCCTTLIFIGFIFVFTNFWSVFSIRQVVIVFAGSITVDVQ